MEYYLPRKSVSLKNDLRFWTFLLTNFMISVSLCYVNYKGLSIVSNYYAGKHNLLFLIFITTLLHVSA
jgi:hypothetical protein